MGMTEKEIYDFFGFADKGEKAAELTDPQNKAEDTGEKGQELATPAEMDVDTEDIDDADADGTADLGGEDEAGISTGESTEDGTEDHSKREKVAQTPEERRKNAALRRKRETDAAISAAVKKAEEQSERDIEMLLSLGSLKDPVTGKPITTKADLEASRANLAEEREKKFLRRTGMSKDEMTEAVESHPDVIAAKRAREEAERVQKKAALDAEIAKIGEIDHNITSLEDIVALPEYSEIYKRVVQNKLSLSDAFRLCRGDAISKESEADRAERLKSAGKAHMRRTGTQGQGAVTVPRATAEYYRNLFPGISDAEIAKHYQKHTK